MALSDVASVATSGVDAGRTAGLGMAALIAAASDDGPLTIAASSRPGAGRPVDLLSCRAPKPRQHSVEGSGKGLLRAGVIRRRPTGNDP